MTAEHPVESPCGTLKGLMYTVGVVGAACAFLLPSLWSAVSTRMEAQETRSIRNGTDIAVIQAELRYQTTLQQANNALLKDIYAKLQTK